MNQPTADNLKLHVGNLPVWRDVKQWYRFAEILNSLVDSEDDGVVISGIKAPICPDCWHGKENCNCKKITKQKIEKFIAEKFAMPFTGKQYFRSILNWLKEKE